MGWGSGSTVFSEVIAVMKEKVEDAEIRAEIYRDLIDVFENADCDTLDECVGDDKVFDEVWEELYPSDEYEEEEEDY